MWGYNIYINIIYLYILLMEIAVIWTDNPKKKTRLVELLVAINKEMHPIDILMWKITQQGTL